MDSQYAEKKSQTFVLEEVHSGELIWSLTFDLAQEKVNKLSPSVLEQLVPILNQLEQWGKAGKVKALILRSGKPAHFIAGADIQMIRKVQNPLQGEELSRQGQELLNRWEDLPFPTVAAIAGPALGGGCEWALACSAIVISSASSARMGLPEVMLGVIPGMGGCIRLPRKIGLAAALDCILTGKTLSGQRAVRVGLAEACLPQENFDESVVHWVWTHLGTLRAGKVPIVGQKSSPSRSNWSLCLEKTPLKAVIFKKARESVLQKTKGHYPAPLEALDVIQETGGSFGEKIRGQQRALAMKRESQGFGKLAATLESKNLIRLFFLTEDVKKSRGIPSATVSVRPEQKISRAGVLGAGIMGGGIAQLFADQGVDIRMKDLNAQALALGVQSASQIFQKQVKKKKINSRQYLQKLARITPVTTYSGFSEVDLVVEAIVENQNVKKQVFQDLESHLKETTIVASNTSSLSISEMQKAFQHPERFAGLHFFNPVEKMPLVEIIRGEKTSDEVIATLFQWSKRLGKTPIVVKDQPGFLVNRLLMPYLNEAVYLVAEGVPILEIDHVLLNFGMPMGPLELIDEVGIDVAEKVAHVLHSAFGERMTPAPLHPKLLAAQHLGKKNQKGLYTYVGHKKARKFDPQIYSILGVSPQKNSLPQAEILDRCLLPMINEAARCLEEKVVSSPAEVDLGMILGTGFPPFRGGLLCHADSVGARVWVEKLKTYEKRFGKRFEPAPGLLKLAESGQKFYSQS